MKYSRFELLALSIGSISIAGTVLATLRGGFQIEEIVAQALLLLVLLGAVHWGRKAGEVTAIIAMVTYLLMRMPLLVRDGFSMDVIGLLFVRMVTYGVVGIAGGRLCSRIRYVLARLDGVSNIDEATGLFNERFAVRSVTAMIAQYERYQTAFSIATVSIADPAVAPDAAPERSVLRAIGAQIRATLRLVDDVARMDDGRFLLILPHTAKPGAEIAARRVVDRVKPVLGQYADVVHTEVFGAAEDLGTIKTLCGIPLESAADSAPSEAAA